MSPAMAEMDAYPKYLYDRVAPRLGSRVWEIGIGHGQFTSLLRRAGKIVLATDIDEQCLQRVAERFALDAAVSFARIDLTDSNTISAQKAFRADSVLCINVLEHIEDDVTALADVREAVVPGAILGLIVPSHPSLFGRMDSEAGHFRRYTRRSLTRTLAAAGWTVDSSRYLNLLGAVGWWYHNRCRKNAGLADAALNAQMRTADRWLPRIARLTDPLFGPICGLSVVALARA